MPDDPHRRTTSFAKSVDGLTHPDSALDREPNLKDRFDEAKEQQQLHQHQSERSGTGQDSQMIKEDAPGMHLRMKGGLARGPNRDAHESKMDRDDAAVKERAADDDLHKAQQQWINEQKRDHDHDKSHDQDHDHDH